MNSFIIRLKKLAVIALAIPMFAMAVMGSGSSNSSNAPDDDIAAVYKAKCVMCHAADGSGNTPAGKKMGVRDLRSEEVKNMSDDELYAVIAKGKEKMPGYEKSLGADKCKGLVAYVRELAK